MHLYIADLTKPLRPSVAELERDTHELSENRLDTEVDAKGERLYKSGWEVISGRRRYDLFQHKDSSFEFRRLSSDHSKFLSYYHTTDLTEAEERNHVGGDQRNPMPYARSFGAALERIAIYEGEGRFWDKVEDIMDLLDIPIAGKQSKHAVPPSPQLGHDARFSIAVNLAIADIQALTNAE